MLFKGSIVISIQMEIISLRQCKNVPFYVWLLLYTSISIMFMHFKHSVTCFWSILCSSIFTSVWSVTLVVTCCVAITVLAPIISSVLIPLLRYVLFFYFMLADLIIKKFLWFNVLMLMTLLIF